MKTKSIISTLAAALVLGGGVVLVQNIAPVQAEAQTNNAKQIVDQAKASGVLGETIAGYLAAPGSASSDVVNAMNEINIRRKSLYTRMARDQNVQIEVIAALTGEKVIAKARSGEKVLDKNGQWITIP